MNIKDEFPHKNGLIHLNHAAICPLPKRTYEAINKFAYENLHSGSKNYLQWQITTENLKQQLCWLINADTTDDIALLKNTSEALSVIAYGIDWRTGDNVVLAIDEFPSNRIVWQSLQQRFNIEIRLVKLESYENPEQSLISVCDQNTRLLTSSSVHYANGLAMQLDVLGHHCKANNILFCVDAIQSLGAVPFDIQSCHADFVVADGHKWLLGLEGLALFYCRPEIRKQLNLNQYGWRMVADPDNFEQLDWQIAATARRFECGTPNTLAIHALNASMSLFQEIGMESISNNIIGNISYLIENIRKIPEINIQSPIQKGRYAGIINFSHASIDSHTLYRRLCAENILCALRGPGIRFAPHFYQDKNDMEMVLDKLKFCIK